MKIYFRYGTHNDKKKLEQNINYRILHGKKQLDMRGSLNIPIKKHGWNFKKGEEAGVVNLSIGSRSPEDSQYFQTVKDKLDKIREDFDKAFISLKVSQKNTAFDQEDWKKWAKEELELSLGIIKAKSEKAPFLIDKFEEWLKAKKNKLTGGTLKYFKTTKNLLESYMDYKRHKYKTDEINLSFYNDFQEWSYEVKEYKPNYFGLQIKNLKAVMKYFRTSETDFKFHVQLDHLDFKTIREDVDHKVLFEEDLELLWNYKGKAYLENARDISIILYRGCLRYSEFYDVINKIDDTIFKYTHKNSKDKWYKWNVHQRKVEERKAINLHSQIERMWKENTLPHRIELQKFNDYIKELCEEVGIKKPKDVASHTFRRSFCTNMYNDENNDIRSIMEYSGHKTERMLLNYIQQKNVTRMNNIATE